MAETLPQTFNFELVSPERKLMSESVQMVTIPGEEGDFGVLPGHMALLATVRPGVVYIWREKSQEPQRVFIAGGFADVTASNCTLLAEQAVNVADLDREALEQTLRNLQEDLSMAQDAAEKNRIVREIGIARGKLDGLAANPYPVK